MEPDDPIEWYDGIEVDEWLGCYKAHKWNALQSDESYAHPAKMANGILDRVFKFLMKQGLLKAGDTVLDPMSGTGRTAIGWLMMHPNNKAITIELEQKFIEFQEQNRAILEKKVGRKVAWTILKGDSRHLIKVLKDAGLYSEDPNNIGNRPDRPVAITSPPHGESHVADKEAAELFARGEGRKIPDGSDNRGVRYGTTEGQIGILRDKPVLVTSPPYASCDQAFHDESAVKYISGGKPRNFKMSDNPDNVANLPDRPVLVTSPPYVGQNQRNVDKEPYGSQVDGGLKRNVKQTKTYSDDPQNIGNTTDKPVMVTSPPYPTQSGGTNVTSKEGPLSDPALLKRQAAGNLAAQGYGKDESNLGNLKDEKMEKVAQETYLDAMRVVYGECGKVCRCIVTVTKNPTREKKIRRLDIDTCKLLMASGFRITHWFHAQLFEVVQQATLDGGVKMEAHGRMSFFKRLLWAKGSPTADHEDIIIGRKD